MGIGVNGAETAQEPLTVVMDAYILSSCDLTLHLITKCRFISLGCFPCFLL